MIGNPFGCLLPREKRLRREKMSDIDIFFDVFSLATSLLKWPFEYNQR